MRHLQDGLTVEEVMAIQDLVQSGEISLDGVGFVLVELVIKAGHFGGWQHGFQVRQKGGQGRVDA